jgi:hypothetical protein
MIRKLNREDVYLELTDSETCKEIAKILEDAGESVYGDSLSEMKKARLNKEFPQLHFYKLKGLWVRTYLMSIDGKTKITPKQLKDLVSVNETFNPQPHYDNSKGSLYKVATERNWNAYLFDVVKRLERGGKKDPLKQEIEKSIDVLKIWMNEL